MVTISINSHSNDAELHIDRQDDVGFVVVTKDGRQYDFSCTVKEWLKIVEFINKNN